MRGSLVPSENREKFQSHELKVTELEILGPSDPGVRSSRPVPPRSHTRRFTMYARMHH